jgi:drug/metabolite transporter (DMT)-like permease
VSNLDSGVVGESAAITTSFLWTISSLFFTSAGKRIGVLSVNAYRTVIAIALLAATHLILLGTIIPLANSGQWFWMGLSGIVGLGIGDSGLFAAYITIGPRRSVLMMALAPIFAAAGAYLMLGETIPALALIGIVITLAGVVMVILESDARIGESKISDGRKAYGVLFGLVGATGQGIGLVLAKKGIYLNSALVLNPISATLMRLSLGAVFIWVLALVARKLPDILRAAKNREGMKNTIAASFVGPYLGITLSMVAVTLTETGIAQTLLSLMPVMIIPVVWIVYGQRTNLRGIVGAIVAVIGVTIIFLS